MHIVCPGRPVLYMVAPITFPLHPSTNPKTKKKKRMVKHSWFLLDGLKVLSEPSISGLSRLYIRSMFYAHTYAYVRRQNKISNQITKKSVAGRSAGRARHSKLTRARSCKHKVWYIHAADHESKRSRNRQRTFRSKQSAIEHEYIKETKSLISFSHFFHPPRSAVYI